MTLRSWNPSPGHTLLVLLTVLATYGQYGACGAEPAAPVPAVHGALPPGPWLRLAPNDESGEGEPAPALLVAGLGPDHVLGEDPLVFKLDTAVPVDLEKDSDGLVLAGERVCLDLKPYWTFDRTTNSFTIAGARLRQFLDALPSGPLQMSVNVVSADGEFAAVYEMPALRKAASR